MENLLFHNFFHNRLWKTSGNVSRQSVITDEIHLYPKDDTLNQKEDTHFEYEKNLDLATYQNGFLLDKEILDHNSTFTLIAYRQTFKALAFLKLEDFDRIDFLEYIIEKTLTRKWAKNTLMNHLQRICVFAHYLSDNHLISRRHRMPNRARTPKLREMPELHEIEYMFEKLLERFEICDFGRKKTRWRDFLIARILFETGCRIGEVCSLKFGDLKKHEDTFYLIVRGGKSESAQRAVKIPEILYKQIQLYCSHFKLRSPDCLLFKSRSGKKVSSVDWAIFIKQFAKDCGVQVVITPHVFRHYFILRFIAGGGSALELMSRLGHSDVRMTVHYFNQVRRLLPFVNVSGDVGILERQMLKQNKFFSKKYKEGKKLNEEK